MREHLSQSRGKLPSLRNFNRLVEVASRLGGSRPGSFLGGLHSGSTDFNIKEAPFQQFVIEVKELDYANYPDEEIWTIYLRYYNSSTKLWVTDTSVEYKLDPKGIDITVAEGDWLIAYWSEQRGMFIPIATSGVGANFATVILKADLLAGGSPVSAAILDDDWQPTGEYLSVYDGCMASGSFAAGAICWVEKGTHNKIRGLVCINEMESP